MIDTIGPIRVAYIIPPANTPPKPNANLLPAEAMLCL